MRSTKKHQHISYSRAELESYVKNPKSCVKKISATDHLGIHVSELSDMKKAIQNTLNEKIGRFYRGGIVLDIRDTKVEAVPFLIRCDSAASIHINATSNFYIFQPFQGAVIKGVVRHFSQRNIGIVVYRVFNVTVKFPKLKKLPRIEKNSEIHIKVRSFNLETHLPEIEGDLIDEEDADTRSSAEEDPGFKIKSEPLTDEDSGPPAEPVKAKKKRKKQSADPETSQSEPETPNGVKEEPDETPRKQKKKDRRSVTFADVKEEEASSSERSSKKKSKKTSRPDDSEQLDETQEPVEVKSEPQESAKKKSKKSRKEQEPAEEPNDTLESAQVKSEHQESAKKKSKKPTKEQEPTEEPNDTLEPAQVKSEHQESAKKKSKKPRKEQEPTEELNGTLEPVHVKSEPSESARKKSKRSSLNDQTPDEGFEELNDSLEAVRVKSEPPESSKRKKQRESELANGHEDLPQVKKEPAKLAEVRVKEEPQPKSSKRRREADHDSDTSFRAGSLKRAKKEPLSDRD